MFPERLLDVELNGAQVFPRYLTSRDHLWVEAALDIATSSVGRARSIVEERYAECPRLGERWPAWQAMAYLLLGLHGFEVAACRPPQQIREALFLAAASAGASSRDAVLAATGRSFGVSGEELARDLYADVASARVLRAPKRPLTTNELIERYNLALVQGLLLRAETLGVALGGQLKAVLRWARLQRLLCSVEAQSGAARLIISGPLSLFHHTLKYGRAMAAWLPALARARRWQLTATCVLKSCRFTLHASHLDPIGSSHVPQRRFDSVLEERFFRDLGRLAPRWSVLREAEVVQVGRHILSPDFTLVDRARGLRVPVEIVGFWTPEYLSSKLSSLRQLPRGRPWVICLDETLAAAAHGELPEGPVFLFRKRIDVEAFLIFLEDCLVRGAAWRGVPPEPAKPPL